MRYFEHEFEAPIERHAVGRGRTIRYTVVWLPADVLSALAVDGTPQLRIEGEIADIPVESALIPAGGGRHYLMVSPAVLKSAGLALGDRVCVRFRRADPERVSVPPELAQALGRDRDADRRWHDLTAGRKRGLSHYVDSAKTPATRTRRVAAVLAAITGRPPEPDHENDVRRLLYLLGKA